VPRLSKAFKIPIADENHPQPADLLENPAGACDMGSMGQIGPNVSLPFFLSAFFCRVFR